MSTQGNTTRQYFLAQLQLQFELRLALLSKYPTTHSPNRKSSWTVTLITTSTLGFDYNFNF